MIDTPRIKLRKLTEHDLVSLHEILGDKETMRFYPSTYDESGTKNWINRSISSYDEHGFGLWAVELKSEPMFIGQCGISLQNINGNTVPEIGYHIHKNHWGNGYATEAAKACLHYGFEVLNLETIYIHTYIKNLPSIKVAEKLGMKKITEYDKYLPSFDITWPHVVYSMNEKDFLP